jgi:hypothetical protein
MVSNSSPYRSKICPMLRGADFGRLLEQPPGDRLVVLHPRLIKSCARKLRVRADQQDDAARLYIALKRKPCKALETKLHCKWPLHHKGAEGEAAHRRYGSEDSLLSLEDFLAKRPAAPSRNCISWSALRPPSGLPIHFWPDSRTPSVEVGMSGESVVGTVKESSSTLLESKSSGLDKM